MTFTFHYDCAVIKSQVLILTNHELPMHQIKNTKYYPPKPNLCSGVAMNYDVYLTRNTKQMT